ncbi:unnamed protein product [Brachionus calyciflorus]|uniref:Nuclear pore complex protein Nup88 n=1 Tax=Brachionus calyciflorus TaxID=104777 RepID=A0A813M8C5_9BILA|nr:unnamed protein product [Brachionus calyciflorus]
MDYSTTVKKSLEENSLLEVLNAFDLEKENILSLKQSNPNIVCSNNSFLFIYLEQSACFLALSLNHLCKTQNLNQYSKSFQCLNINSTPIGQFKKLLINQAGTYILLVYDKSVTCVELPSKWGKYDQFDGGKQNLMCKTIKFAFHKNVGINDAIWHTKKDDDCIVCFTSDQNLKLFKVSVPNSPVKEFHFSNQNFDNLTSNKNHGFTSLDMGDKFEYNDMFAYPIYVLNGDSQIECLIDYESRNFDYIGPLSIRPYLEENEKGSIISFICLSGQPNCLVTLSADGILNHCVLLTNTKDFELTEILNEDDDLNENVILYVYETLNAFESSSEILKLAKDPSNSARYFVCHSNGLHSVYLQWLENLRFLFETENLNEFSETNMSEVNYLISTNPFHKSDSANELIGLTIIYDFGKTSRTLVCLDNQAKVICLNIEIPNQNNNLNIQYGTKESVSEQQDMFSNYIASLLKRETNMPVLMAKLENDLADMELLTSSNNIVNLIRNEYIEKQKKVVLEFQKRCKLLKQQEKIQSDTIKDINTKLDSLKTNKENLSLTYKKILNKQTNLEERLENVFNRIFQKQCFPLNENEAKIFKELKAIRNNLREVDEQVTHQKKLFSQKDQGKSVDQDQCMHYDQEEMAQIKNLLRNESEKIKDLIQKVEIVKSTINK